MYGSTSFESESIGLCGHPWICLCAVVSGSHSVSFDASALSSLANSIRVSTDAEVVAVFNREYDRTSELAGHLQHYTSKYKGESAETIKVSMTNDMEAIDQATKEINDEIASRREKLKDIEDDTRTGSQALRKARMQTQSAVAAWNNNPQVHNPVKPDRSQIVVPTTERKFDGYKDVKKTRRYRDSKGEWKEETTTEREEKYITVRRSQADIDRDIESTFRVLQADYEQKLLLRSELLKAKEFADDSVKEAQSQIAAAKTTEQEVKTTAAAAETFKRQLELKQKSMAIAAAAKACSEGEPRNAYLPR